jgi:hypothetical protein
MYSVPLAYGQGAAVGAGWALDVGGVSITGTDTDPIDEVAPPPPTGTLLDVVD